MALANAADQPEPAVAPPPWPDFVLYWLKLGCVSFGGPAGQIAMMQHELVDRRGWIDQTRFLHALNFCMMLPGPEAQQLATYVGWRLRGIVGGLVAGLLFILPGAAVLLALSWAAAAKGDTPAVAALFHGIKPVVVAIIAAAVWRIGRRTCRSPAAAAIAVAAFLGIFFLKVPFPAIVLGAAVIGLGATRCGRDWFKLPHGPGNDNGLPAGPSPSLWRLVVLVAVFAILWAGPVWLAIRLLGPVPYAGIATLFAKAAFVTFGGAYAVLPYIAAAAVDFYHWLSPAQMIDGLALAESTPGPLILVTQYVGFFAGWNHAVAAPGGLSPALAGAAGAGLTLYVTFLPCFFFIFAGAPYVERLIHNRAVAGALGAVTAAVVGVILNLGVYLGIQVLMPAGHLDLFALAVAGAALVALLRGHIAVHWLVLAGAAAGLGWGAVSGGL
ncbi:MAG: chromate efflux transporter [Azospirillum sp.]|nr:chromate efflux transporter [Azospirillum sp.]